jgi:hypothetical protein
MAASRRSVAAFGLLAAIVHAAVLIIGSIVHAVAAPSVVAVDRTKKIFTTRGGKMNFIQHHTTE